ncbi:hypothetical protein [Bradyrhizobium neotropicale]|uniref:hypothetical protein n=1 Tax=Bradyrhizobium neotropicale TaxID=1497615 RepID=UPI001AD7C0CC|nr:hypothetical protein [Bradyrhizobium neotropicale]MBO4228378.1 hypothetical protein [Bradyrhizobium neotropicale]
MGALEEGGKVATGTVEALKKNPIALALVVINLTFLLAFAFMLREISQAVERKDELLSELAKRCVVLSPNKGDRQ